ANFLFAWLNHRRKAPQRSLEAPEVDFSNNIKFAPELVVQEYLGVRNLGEPGGGALAFGSVIADGAGMNSASTYVQLVSTLPVGVTLTSVSLVAPDGGPITSPSDFSLPDYAGANAVDFAKAHGLRTASMGLPQSSEEAALPLLVSVPGGGLGGTLAESLGLF